MESVYRNTGHERMKTYPLNKIATRAAMLTPLAFWACMGVTLSFCSWMLPMNFYLSITAIEPGNLFALFALSLLPLAGLGWLLGKVYEPEAAAYPRRCANTAVLTHTALLAVTIQAAAVGAFLAPGSGLTAYVLLPIMFADLPVTLLAAGGAWALGTHAMTFSPLFSVLFSVCALLLGGAMWAVIGYAIGEWREKYPVHW